MIVFGRQKLTALLLTAVVLVTPSMSAQQVSCGECCSEPAESESCCGTDVGPATCCDSSASCCDTAIACNCSNEFDSAGACACSVNEKAPPLPEGANGKSVQPTELSGWNVAQSSSAFAHVDCADRIQRPPADLIPFAKSAPPSLQTLHCSWLS